MSLSRGETFGPVVHLCRSGRWMVGPLVGDPRCQRGKVVSFRVGGDWGRSDTPGLCVETGFECFRDPS